MKKGNVLVLRKCKEDMVSENGFKYPKKGYVEAPDWNYKKKCGCGLHGLLWGSGSFDIEGYGELFVVIECNAKDVIEFDGKCKFKCGNVILVTKDSKKVYKLLKKHAPKAIEINYAFDTESCVYGYRSTVTTECNSTVTTGSDSTVTTGSGSIVTTECNSTVKTKSYSSVTTGSGSTVTTGSFSTVTIYGNNCVVTTEENCCIIIFLNNTVYIAKSGVDFKCNIKTKIYVEDNILKFEEIK